MRPPSKVLSRFGIFALALAAAGTLLRQEPGLAAPPQSLVDALPVAEVCGIKASVVAKHDKSLTLKDAKETSAILGDTSRDCIYQGKYYLLTHHADDNRWLAVQFKLSEIGNLTLSNDVNPSSPYAASPARPAQVEIREESGIVEGAMTELFAGLGVYVTNRHVLEGRSLEEIQRSLASANIDLAKQRCYLFHRKGTGFPGDPSDWHELDAVLMMPAKPRDYDPVFFEPDFAPEQLRCQANLLGSTFFKMKLRSTGQSDLATDVSIQDKYFSFHDGVQGNDETKGFSAGQISELARSGRFFLPSAVRNRASPSSSGSIVYTQKPSEVSWKAAGVVECKIPENGTGLDHPGDVRVIPFSLLLDSFAEPVSCTSPRISTPRERSKDCVPISRDGGGH